MEKYELILWFASICFSIAGTILLFISLKKRRITTNLITAALYGLAVILRAITLPYSATVYGDLFIWGSSLGAITSIINILPKKHREKEG